MYQKPWTPTAGTYRGGCFGVSYVSDKRQKGGDTYSFGFLVGKVEKLGRAAPAPGNRPRLQRLELLLLLPRRLADRLGRQGAGARHERLERQPLHHVRVNLVGARDVDGAHEVVLDQAEDRAVGLADDAVGGPEEARERQDQRRVDAQVGADHLVQQHQGAHDGVELPAQHRQQGLHHLVTVARAVASPAARHVLRHGGQVALEEG